MGRYSLKVDIPGEGCFTVNVPENGLVKEKVSLMAVDSFTINKTPNAIFKELDFDSAKVVGRSKIYVSYMSKGEEKHLYPLFEDVKGIKEIADKNERQVSPDNKVLNKFIEKEFMPLIRKSDFIAFLRKEKLLTLKLEEWINNYKDGYYEADFCLQKITEYASNYKQLRALMIGVELYKDADFLKRQTRVKEEASSNDIQKETLERPIYDYFLKKAKDLEDVDPDTSYALYSEEELEKLLSLIEGEEIDLSNYPEDDAFYDKYQTRKK